MDWAIWEVGVGSSIDEFAAFVMLHTRTGPSCVTVGLSLPRVRPIITKRHRRLKKIVRTCRHRPRIRTKSSLNKRIGGRQTRTLRKNVTRSLRKSVTRTSGPITLFDTVTHNWSSLNDKVTFGPMLLTWGFASTICCIPFTDIVTVNGLTTITACGSIWKFKRMKKWFTSKRDSKFLLAAHDQHR